MFGHRPYTQLAQEMLPLLFSSLVSAGENVECSFVWFSAAGAVAVVPVFASQFHSSYRAMS